MFLNELCKDIRYDDKIEQKKCDYLLLYFVKFNSIQFQYINIKQ